MRRVIALAIIAFTVTLSVVVGSRLSSEAMAVVVGTVCGVLAGIPTSVLLLVVVRRLREEPTQQPQQRQPAYPPVIVINPNAGQPHQPPNPFYDPPESRPAGYLPREFRIIGEAGEED
ncbi:MAG: hypothetical protein ACE5HA_15190 [Anaerolineae bacterium]